MPRPRPIAEFWPQWLRTDEPLRFGMGVSIHCPHHGPSHRLEFWFSNPCDGEEPLRRPGLKLWHRLGGRLDDLTVSPMDGLEDLTVSHLHGSHHPLHVPAHWTGWIEHGELQTATELDVADADAPTQPNVPTLDEGEE